MSEEELDKLIRDCHERWKDAWGTGFREKDPDRAVQEIKEYMEEWMMFWRTEEEIRLLPMVGKVSGFYPDDYDEKDKVGDGDA